MAASAALLLAGGLGAQAATNDAGPVVQNSQAAQATDSQASGSMNIRQQLQAQLSKNGYTDVQIMPSSFVVRAKDKQGNPVEMVIGPDSFIQVTEVPMPNSAGTSGAGATGNSAASGNATPPKQ